MQVSDPAKARRRASGRLATAAGALGLAGPVQGRIFFAALVPLCLMLGPMIMTFLWFPARVDPASWNAEPGAAVDIVATIDSTVRSPITLRVVPPLQFDELSPPQRELPPIRQRLERVLAEWRTPSDLSAQPWEIQQAAESARRQRMSSLEAFLKQGVPPRNVSWKLRTPARTPGVFPVTVQVEGAAPVTLRIVLGDGNPPAPAEFEADRGPIRRVKIVYPHTETKRVFWAPFGRLFGPSGYEDAGLAHSENPLAHILRPSWDAGWLLTYLAAYLPAMYLCRKVLGIA